jgi:hypothetical protein
MKERRAEKVEVRWVIAQKSVYQKFESDAWPMSASERMTDSYKAWHEVRK